MASADTETKKPFPEGELPFCYQDPLNMYVYWICDRDSDGKLVSIFTNDEGERDSYHAYMTEDEALMQRKLLRKEHWQPMSKPQITIQNEREMFDASLVPGERTPKKGEPTVRQRLRKKLEEKSGKGKEDGRIW